MTGIRVNFSAKEASAENVDLEPLPTGKYLCAITDASLEECGEGSKNAGKNYYKFEFTVQEGKYEGRKCWTNAMLFENSLYTIVKMLKALGVDVSAGEFEVPEAEWFQAQQLVVSGVRLGEQKDKKDPSKVYAPKFEPKNFFPASTWKTAETKPAKANSLLP